MSEKEVRERTTAEIEAEVEFATDHGIPVFFGTAEEFVDHYSRRRVV